MGLDALRTMSLDQLIRELSEHLLLSHRQLRLAESCTGGLVAAACTSVAGSSRWFDRGVVTYSNESKQELLGVAVETLTIYGAVSEPVAKEMALGALANHHQRVAASITGIAGPDGGSELKPVGTVCFAWALFDPKTGQPVVKTMTQHFLGDRQEVRLQALETSLTGVLMELKHFPI